MPYVAVRILRGATTRQKRQVVEDMTRTLVDVLGKSPEHIHIVIDEIEPESWGYAGRLTLDFRPQAGQRRGKRGHEKIRRSVNCVAERRSRSGR